MEVAQQLTAHNAFSENLSSVPSACNAAPSTYNSNSQGSGTLFWPPRAPDSHAHTSTHVYNLKVISKGGTEEINLLATFKDETRKPHKWLLRHLLRHSAVSL